MDTMVTSLAKYQRQPDSVCAYGLLLYSPADVHIRQILDQDKYCDALDTLSGPRWTIFFARVPVYENSDSLDRPPYSSRAKREAETRSLGDERPREQSQQQQMQQMQKQVDQWEYSSLPTLMASLGLTDRLTALPQLLVVVPTDDEEAYVRALHISARSSDEAFQSLRDIIVSATRVFEGIAPENLKNADGVIAAFDLARHEARIFKAATVGIRLFTFAKQIFV